MHSAVAFTPHTYKVHDTTANTLHMCEQQNAVIHFTFEEFKFKGIMAKNILLNKKGSVQCYENICKK